MYEKNPPPPATHRKLLLVQVQIQSRRFDYPIAGQQGFVLILTNSEQEISSLPLYHRISLKGRLKAGTVTMSLH